MTMAGNTDVPVLLDALLRDPQSLDEEQRSTLANHLRDAFESAQAISESEVAAARLLARDPKWQTRKVIAGALPFLDDDVFASLAAVLCADPNFFVKTAAEKAMDRRRKTRRAARRKEQSLRHCNIKLERFRQKHGNEAAEGAIEIAIERANLLLGSIAHDLRSILTPMKAAAVGIPSSATDPKAARSKGKAVTESISFLERCVSDMESYAAPLPVERRPEDLRSVLIEAHELALRNVTEIGYDRSDVRFSMEAPDGLRIRIARYLMVLTLSNLLKNAYESFMTGELELAPGEIAVAVVADATDVVITIRDNGMGMGTEDLTELRSLIPIRRNKAKRRSTGFGLPIADRYVEAHGGTLTIQSTADRGTVVTIVLPRGQDEEEGVT